MSLAQFGANGSARVTVVVLYALALNCTVDAYAGPLALGASLAVSDGATDGALEGATVEDSCVEFRPVLLVQCCWSSAVGPVSVRSYS